MRPPRELHRPTLAPHRYLLAAVIAGAPVPPALAQEATPPEPTEGPSAPEAGEALTGNLHEVQAPVLIDFVEAPYPEQARESRQEGDVVLRLTIDADGRVSDAQIVQSAGLAFDEAAQQAALGFRFKPAQRGTTPMAARVLYTYEFRLPPEPEMDVPGEPPIALGSIKGHLLPPASNGEVAAGVLVTLIASNGTSHTAITDWQGRFEIAGLAPGTYRLVVKAPGLGTAAETLVVRHGATTRAPIRLLSSAPVEATVTVRGLSAADRLRQSAEAVEVVETDDAKRKSADLGEVLARTRGVSVRRSGGLGSGMRFSLNGLTHDQIRFFLDGIPLEFSGFPHGLSVVPVNFVNRVEIYRGVVPVRFGADALGGAVNIVTDNQVEGTRASGSFMAGSFGTYRTTLAVRTTDEPTGIHTRASAFYDTTDNDYPINVQVPDERGRLSPARVHRFHDGYRAGGVSAETGVVDKPWAKRLLLRGFVGEYDKELQHNAAMTVPYGAVKYGELSAGATLRYKNVFVNRFSIGFAGGYTYGRLHFLDAGACVYDWFGQCVRARRQAGEIESQPRDRLYWEHAGFGRLHLGWQAHPSHALRLSVGPSYVTRTGDERRQMDPNARDPLTAERDLLTVVSGLQYKLNVFDDRLQNIAFVKDYRQQAWSEEPLPGNIFRERGRSTQRYGVGDGLRYRFVSWLYAKASYEWATRLPRPDEVFGNGVLIIANLELEPEISHNGNLGATMDLEHTEAGSWRLDINGFLRDAEQLIVLLGNDRVHSYQNVYSARSLGVEGAAGWTSPGDYLALDGNVTYQSYRNTSSEGTFADFEGDRIPNQPYFFANGNVRLQFGGVSAANDELALEWHTRYVHEFFRGWESVGLREFKQVVDSQTLHSLALVYLVRDQTITLSNTFEVDNLTDALAYDFFGVQKPGRAFYYKATAEF